MDTLVVDSREGIVPAIALATGLTVEGVHDVIAKFRVEGKTWLECFEYFRRLAEVRGNVLHAVRKETVLS